jgi:predicted phage-related endonuclease
MSGLTAEQIARRRHSIGGSDANILMSGNQDAIHGLWEIKIGLAEPEDLTWVQPVQFGTYTEPLNRRWYSHKTGNEISAVGDLRVHPTLPYMTSNLDGIVEAEKAVFEAKCINAFSNSDEAAQKYMPQLHHNMLVTGLSRAVLSVFIGTLKYEHFIVEKDPFYAATLLENESAFWSHVMNKTPPGELTTIATPGGKPAVRRVDMKTSNAWATHASIWRASRDIAKKFETASKEIKALVEDDVAEAHGHGITCKRAKNGNLTISEIKL